MSDYHNYNRIWEIGRLRLLAKSFAHCASPSAVSLGILVWAGCWVGRRVHTTFRGLQVYPSLFLFLIGPPSVCGLVLRSIQYIARSFGEPVRTVHMGVKSPLAVVYLARDPWVRPEKQFTELNEPARYSRVVVDESAPERRILITQGTLAAILGRKAGASLTEALIESFYGHDLSVFMNPRDGGYLSSSEPHICICSPCSVADIAALPRSLRDACLFAEGQLEPFFGDLKPAESKELDSLIVDCYLALGDVSGKIPLEPGALQIIEDYVRTLPFTARTAAATMMVKISLTLAVLDSCSAIGRLQAAAATEFLKESRRVSVDCEASEQQTRIEAVARHIENALRENPKGLSGAQISDLFSGNLKRGVLKAAKELLFSQKRANVVCSPTDGRPREHWSLGGAA